MATRTQRPLAILTLAVMALLGGAAVHADPQPPPSAIEEFPSATRDDVVKALRKVRRKYGEHAVLIETQLLINAMQRGSLRATAVGVDGVRPYRDKRYLAFDVETGLIFDSMTLDETRRIHLLWTTIMVPTLERLTALQVPADGIKVRMRYHHRPYRSLEQLRASIEEPGTPEETCFYLLTGDLDALVDHSVSGSSLLTHARVTVNGAERVVAAPGPEGPVAPGPQ